MIRQLNRAELEGQIDELCTLLIDAVDSGASLGFLPPLLRENAAQYWRSVVAAIHKGSRVMLAAYDGNRVIGTVQLDLATKANALHRAEVCKLMVHRDARGQGTGKALMAAVESAAAASGRTLLVLDTRQGDPSESLYRQLGYATAGVIPNYARSADGRLHATVFFYKDLSGGNG